MRMTAVQFLRSAYARKEGLPFQKGGSLNGRQHRIIQMPWINPRGLTMRRVAWLTSRDAAIFSLR